MLRIPCLLVGKASRCFVASEAELVRCFSPVRTYSSSYLFVFFLLPLLLLFLSSSFLVLPHHVALVVPLAVDNQSIVDIASWLKVF